MIIVGIRFLVERAPDFFPDHGTLFPLFGAQNFNTGIPVDLMMSCTSLVTAVGSPLITSRKKSGGLLCS